MEYKGELPEEKAIPSSTMLCPKNDPSNNVNNHNHLRQYRQKFKVTQHSEHEQQHLPSKATQYEIHRTVIQNRLNKLHAINTMITHKIEQMIHKPEFQTHAEKEILYQIEAKQMDLLRKISQLSEVLALTEQQVCNK